jgi:hypothetical protein
MKPIVKRELGGVSAAQPRDERTNGATAADATACFRNERRVTVMGDFLSHNRSDC